MAFAHFNPAPLIPSKSSFCGLLSWALDATSAANLGVLLFFVLSSFLLTYLAIRERAESRAFNVKRFYLRRCLRIWPLYIAVLLTVLAVVRMGGPLHTVVFPDESQWGWVRRHLWMFLAFVSNWSMALNSVWGYVDRTPPSLAHLWSIGVEEQFYAFFPWLIVLACRSRPLAWVLAATLFCIGVGSRVVFLLLPVGRADLGAAGGLYYATFVYADVLLAGAAAGWLFARGIDPLFRWVRLLQKRGSGVVLLGGIGVGGYLWRSQRWYPYSKFSVFLYGYMAVLFAFGILWIMVNRDSPLSRLLRTNPARSIGMLSYGIYLWHPLAGILLMALWQSLPMTTSVWVNTAAVATFLLYLGGILGLSVVSQVLIERPFLKLKSRLAIILPSVLPKPVGPSERDRLWIVAPFCCVLLIIGGAGVTSVAGGSGKNPADASYAADLGLSPEGLSKILGVPVECAPGEIRQFIIRAPQGTARFAELGTIHLDLGYAVGVTLRDGMQLGFRYEPTREK